jgi:hypothetical protein
MKEDLSETRDLSDSNPDKVDEMNNELEKWLEKTGARIPIPKAEKEVEEGR